MSIVVFTALNIFTDINVQLYLLFHFLTFTFIDFYKTIMRFCYYCSSLSSGTSACHKLHANLRRSNGNTETSERERERYLPFRR